MTNAYENQTPSRAGGPDHMGSVDPQCAASGDDAEDVCPLQVRWVAIAAILCTCLAGVLVFTGPGRVAGRLTAAFPAKEVNEAFARDLLRNLALCLIGGSVAVAGGWALTRRLSQSLVNGCGVLVCIGIYVAGTAAFWWYVDDDAGITFTYARNLVEGHGLVLNPGGERVEGYSNPLWLLVLAGARLAGLDIVVTAKVLGLLFGAAAIVVVWALLNRSDHSRSPWHLAAPLLTAMAAPFVIWNGSGLENALHALLLVTLAALLARGAAGRASPVALAVVLSLLVLSRPEGMLFSGSAFVYLLALSLRRRDRSWKLFRAFAAPVMVILALTAFRYIYFHDLLPNTYYAKAGSSNPFRMLNPFSGGWRYVAQGFHAGGWSMLLIPMLAACLHRPSRSPVLDAAIVVIATHLFFVISVGGDWMLQYRFLSPIVPLWALVAAAGLASAHKRLTRAFSSPWRASTILLVPLVLALWVSFPQMVAFAAKPTTPMDAVAAIGLHFQNLARQAGIEHPTLLAHDAGGTSYVARIELIDLGALCDRTVARHADDPQRMREYIFREKRPTFIFSSKIFADRIGLERFPEFHADYLELPRSADPRLNAYIQRVRRDVSAALISPP